VTGRQRAGEPGELETARQLLTKKQIKEYRRGAQAIRLIAAHLNGVVVYALQR